MNILLQAGGSMTQSLIFMVVIIAIFYFFMIRPQQKKQKAIQKAREAMNKGDKVVTAGGIHGRIKDIGEDHFLIEVSNGVIIKLDKASVFAAGTEAAN